MAFGIANRYVEDCARSKTLQRLHEDRSGGLTVHVEVAPDADRLPIPNGLQNAFDEALDSGIGRRRSGVRLQEAARSLRIVDAARQEDPFDQGRQSQGGQRTEACRLGVDPAHHRAPLRTCSKA